MHYSAMPFTKACIMEGVEPEGPVLHSDDGEPMKGSTMVAQHPTPPQWDQFRNSPRPAHWSGQIRNWEPRVPISIPDAVGSIGIGGNYLDTIPVRR